MSTLQTSAAVYVGLWVVQANTELGDRPESDTPIDSEPQYFEIYHRSLQSERSRILGAENIS
jgi:hypothetical protein